MRIYRYVGTRVINYKTSTKFVQKLRKLNHGKHIYKVQMFRSSVLPQFIFPCCCVFTLITIKYFIFKVVFICDVF